MTPLEDIRQRHRYARRCLVLLMRAYTEADYLPEDRAHVTGRLIGFLHAGVITPPSYRRLALIAKVYDPEEEEEEDNPITEEDTEE